MIAAATSFASSKSGRQQHVAGGGRHRQPGGRRRRAPTSKPSVGQRCPTPTSARLTSAMPVAMSTRSHETCRDCASPIESTVSITLSSSENFSSSRTLAFGRDEREAAVQPLRRRVAADERADAGAVGRRHAAQVEHDVPVAAAVDVLDAVLELFSRSAGDERLLRRHHEAAARRGFLEGIRHPVTSVTRRYHRHSDAADGLRDLARGPLRRSAAPQKPNRRVPRLDRVLEEESAAAEAGIDDAVEDRAEAVAEADAERVAVARLELTQPQEDLLASRPLPSAARCDRGSASSPRTC